MKISWAAPARRDLTAHLDFLAARNAEAALALGDTIRAAVETLGDYPLRGRPGRLDGTRELVVVGSPYVVVYSVSATRVTVLRVLHAAQDWPPRARTRRRQS
jgi:toxin ParE1/3/4